MDPRRSVCVLSAVASLIACGCDDSSASGETFGFWSSPANGEAGVATTRESILTFDLPIDPDTMDDEVLTASVSDRPVNARVHVYKNSLRASLFYPDGLPGDATVLVAVDGNKIRSKSGLLLDGDGDGLPGGIGVFSFETVSLIPVPGTDVCSRVFASELDDDGVNRPLEGVRISVDGASDSIWTVTGANGRFCLEDAPANRIFVHLDGRTAVNAPPNTYYPFVGKAWTTLAGERTDVGLIHLPAIADTTLAPVSRDTDTEIDFSEEQRAMVSDPFIRGMLDDVRLTVPADSLFSDDGARGGMVGIAPVAWDRLPGALPLGLELPLVITVQTDGPTNFDEPAPVCFMNLPNPITGVIPEPGDTTSLFSFNHDTGRFEVVGAMTVENEGRTVCSDPGVGILAPGWHGSATGTEGESRLPRGSSLPPLPRAPECDELELEVLQAAKTIGSCFKGIAGIGKLVESIGEIAGQLQDLSEARERFQNAFETFAAGDTDRGEIRLAMAELRALKGALNELIDVASETQSPLSKAIDILDCAEQALNLAKEPCDGLQPRTGCGLAENQPLSKVCETLPEVTEAVELAKTLLEGANNQIKDVAFTAVCAAFDQAETLLEEAASNDDLLEGLRDLADSVNDVPIYDEEESTALRTFWDGLVELTDHAADAEVARERPASSWFVKVEIGRATQRLTSDDSGYYRAMIPSDAYYALLAFEPLSGRCGINIGRSASPGERTLFHGPQLDECEALDSDRDGLPDFAEDIIGTAIENIDTDGDGIDDHAEVLAGTDPGGRSTIEIGALIEGDLAGPGEVDVWRLVANEPSRMFLEVLGVIVDRGQIQFEWRAPDGSPIAVSAAFPMDPSVASRPVELSEMGVYRLSISATNSSVDGSYRFRVHESVTDELVLHIGEPSVGEIARPGDVDRWLFEATVGDELFFDMQELVGVRDTAAFAALAAPSGALMFARVGSPESFEATMDFGPFTLTETGIHTLQVSLDISDSVFSYRFVLDELAPSSSTEISIGATHGGTITTAGATREWTFAATSGDRAFLDITSVTGRAGAILEIDIVAPNGASLSSIATTGFPDSGDIGPIDLTQNGTYRLIFRSTTAGVSYNFVLYKPTIDRAALTLGVTTGGNVAVPGEVDEWQFGAASGTSVSLEVLTATAIGNAAYEFNLFAPSGAAVFEESGITGFPFPLISWGPGILPQTGLYRLQVRCPPNLDDTFTYTFRLDL